MIHRVFGIDNRAGLTTTLLKHGNPLEYVRTTSIPGLSVLTSGPIPPNPAELLMTSTMKDFIDHVRIQFDHVLFDTPPVTIVTDAAIMSTKVDGTILVVRSGHVDRRLLKRCRELLDQVKANILGVIVNGINRENEAYYNQYYYKSYYGEDLSPSKKRKHHVRKKRSPDIGTGPVVREPQGLRQDFGRNEPLPPQA
jgi:capsular exopolysaccharide synthesis family protein